MKIDQEYLELLENIRSTLEEIQLIADDLGELGKNPASYLEHLEEIRSTLEEIQLQKDEFEEEN